MSELKRIKLDPEAAPYLKELDSTSSIKSTESGVEEEIRLPSIDNDESTAPVAVVGDDDDSQDDEEEEESSEDEAELDHPRWSEEQTEEATAAIFAVTDLCEPNLNFWVSCKKVSENCEAGHKFYCSFVQAIASLIHAIYDLQDLHRHNLFPEPLLDEMILFRGELDQHQFQYEHCSPPDTCKWLREKIDWKKYSLLTDRDVFYLIFYCTRDMDFPPKFHNRYSVLFELEEIKGKGLYDDFRKAWASAKASNPLKTDDCGIELLKEFAFGGYDLQAKLRDKAMEKIECGSLPKSLKIAKSCIINILFERRFYVRGVSKLPDQIWIPLQLHFVCFASDDVNDLIRLAELRRKLNGCRFISREHFLWAFVEAKLEYLDKWRLAETNTMDAEDAADCPLYSVYMTSLLLATSLGSATVELEHFVFAVFHGFKMDYSDEELKTMKEAFAKCSSDGTRLRMVSFSYREAMPGL